jgi:hypothetical protein
MGVHILEVFLCPNCRMTQSKRVCSVWTNPEFGSSMMETMQEGLGIAENQDVDSVYHARQ